MFDSYLDEKDAKRSWSALLSCLQIAHGSVLEPNGRPSSLAPRLVLAVAVS